MRISKRNIVILAVAASLTAIVIAPGFAADDAKTIAQRLDDNWIEASIKTMLPPSLHCIPPMPPCCRKVPLNRSSARATSVSTSMG